MFPSAVTCIELTDGKISLIKWAIEVDSKDVLYINKTIIGGPENLEKYFYYAKQF